jgi:thiol-disulfide isomerase/thioredoxin
MKKLFFLFSILFFLKEISFAQQSPVRQMSNEPLRIHLGSWRGVLTLNDTTELPFIFIVDKDPQGYTLTVRNGEENIPVENLIVTKDSINWHMPVFDSWFKCKIDSLSGFHGTFFNNSASRPYQLKFLAVRGAPRFSYGYYMRPANFTGKWECEFSPGTSDSSMAIANFNSSDNGMTGTFLTETGDFRYLEGNLIDGFDLSLSTFDGSHAFLFTAHYEKDGTLKGNVWYGKYGHENWIGKRNENFQLRDPEKLTYIKDSSNVNFTFNDLNGKPVSLSDPKFKGKVVIIQIMGSWCPNCMDETAFMTDAYKKYNSQGLEIIALAYERSTDTAKANPNIRRVKNHFNAGYTFLNTGKSGKDSAAASLPFLNGIMSFPTTIYIDRTGKVRMVYTGYNGPATGAAYEKDSAESLRLIQQLLAEKPKK